MPVPIGLDRRRAQGTEDLVDLAIRESYAPSTLEEDAHEQQSDEWFSVTTLGLADQAYRRALKQRSFSESLKQSASQTMPQSQARLPRELRLINDIGIVRDCHPYHSCLWPGRRFQGVQQSGRATYEVAVTLDHIDTAESRIAGTLCITGLSVDHPTLTTFFEGEIIGPKYSFTTHHKHWGASEKTDIEHWSRIAAFTPLASHAAVRQKARARQRGGAAAADSSVDCELRLDHLFMRWKELYAIESVEDVVRPAAGSSSATRENDFAALRQRNHEQRRRILENISYEGYYYCVISLVTGHISGMYFHEASELYQQLSLKPVDSTHFPSYEWR